MSWLARSIANSLRLDDDEDDNNPQHLSPKAEEEEEQHGSKSDPSSPTTPERGVKEDLSELKKTLTRQLWGVASFLAPPPQSQIPDPSAEHLDPESSDAEAVAGIRNDFAEIGGRFRSGISKLSSNIPVSEFSNLAKIASNFLSGGEGSAEGAIGVTDEVVAFVKDIAMHPETWLDFPLPDDEEDDDDFDLSDAQQEHALAVETLAPRLAALRMELCPGYMSEESFWKIYFVLLHPRLSKHDALLLSTPQVMEARASLTLELQTRNKGKQLNEKSAQFICSSSNTVSSPPEKDISVPSNAQFESVPLDVQAIEVTTLPVNAESETVKHPIQNSDIPIDKSVVEEGPVSSPKDQTSYADSSSKVSDDNYEDDGDDWLKEESSETAPASGTRVPIDNEEDVSFSDLEEDDDGDVPTSYKKVTYGSDSSTKDSRDWVQLGRSSTDSTKDSNATGADRARNADTKESNDWLDIDEIDVE